MKKVYILYDYSEDYFQIEAVFSSEKKAEAYKKSYGDMFIGYDIESFKYNPKKLKAKKLKYGEYGCRFYIENRELVICSRISGGRNKYKETHVDTWVINSNPKQVGIYVWAKTEKTAEKIARKKLFNTSKISPNGFPII